MTIKIPGEIPAAIPEKMRAISIGEDNSPGSLSLNERDTPRPDKHEILVKIGAAGVNRGDCFQRMGFYPPPPGASEIMGLEFAGTIVACGSGVTRWQVGARVAGLVAGGGYAEYGLVHEAHALEIPKNMSFTDAAALPESIYTVWANVFELGGLVAGETLLIHGGSSGIGTTAIQMAKHCGAIVATTAGTDEKCDFCEKLGADLTIASVSFSSVVNTATATTSIISSSTCNRRLNTISTVTTLISTSSRTSSTCSSTATCSCTYTRATTITLICSSCSSSSGCITSTTSSRATSRAISKYISTTSTTSRCNILKSSLATIISTCFVTTCL